MAQKCSICTHPEAKKINAALIQGESLRNIAERFGVSTTSLHRHKRHIPLSMVKAREAREAAEAGGLLAQVLELRDRALAILDRAESAGDLRTALQGIREARGCLELLARLQGELQERFTVNVLTNPQWLSLRATILQALEPYPEARLRLAEALREVENGAGG